MAQLLMKDILKKRKNTSQHPLNLESPQVLAGIILQLLAQDKNKAKIVFQLLNSEMKVKVIQCMKTTGEISSIVNE